MKAVNVYDFVPKERKGKAKIGEAIKAARAAGVIYCGRGTPVGNEFSCRSGTAAKYKVPTLQDAIECYRLWLYLALKARKKEVVDFIEALPDNALLGCSCVPRPCHVKVLIRAIAWWKAQKQFLEA